MRKCFFFILIFVSAAAMAQDSFDVQPAQVFDASGHVKNNSRKWLIGTASVLGYGGSFIFLNEAWYKGYPRSSFHTFNDAGEWMQMDKIGHAWTAYHTSRVNTALWNWAGVSDRRSVLLGSGTSLLYMLSIEYLDGRSAEWGWSWPDAGADIFGASLFAVQQLTWQEQKISIKFSSHRKNYQPESLEQRANDLFGKSLQERLLKDYNAQTYWLSLNIRSILKNSQLPSWLNIAVGYGADGMLGGYQNLAFDKDGNISFDRRDIKRLRQWYLAPDIDLTKIKTKSSFLRTVFSVVNVLKIPAPALELSNGKLKGHWVTF
ncbi:MAG: DUF2279 domain-containing protein [Flavisolibacter sp.]